jgi:hypothetical protein
VSTHLRGRIAIAQQDLSLLLGSTATKSLRNLDVIKIRAMFSFLRHDLPAVGRVFYSGAIPPPLDQLSVFGAPVTWTQMPASPEQLWSVKATHPVWGAADIACDRHLLAFPEELIIHAVALSDDEKARALAGQPLSRFASTLTRSICSEIANACCSG